MLTFRYSSIGGEVRAVLGRVVSVLWEAESHQEDREVLEGRVKGVDEVMVQGEFQVPVCVRMCV